MILSRRSFLTGIFGVAVVGPVCLLSDRPRVIMGHRIVSLWPMSHPVPCKIMNVYEICNAQNMQEPIDLVFAMKLKNGENMEA